MQTRAWARLHIAAVAGLALMVALTGSTPAEAAGPSVTHLLKMIPHKKERERKEKAPKEKESREHVSKIKALSRFLFRKTR